MKTQNLSILSNNVQIFYYLYFFKIIFSNAEIVKSINVSGNDRITNETIIIFSKINVGDDLIINDLNEIITIFIKLIFLKMFQLILKIVF